MESLEKSKLNINQEGQLDSKKLDSGNEEQIRKYFKSQYPDFENRNIRRIEYMIRDLILELAPSIKNHEYDLIVGDDASGRLPTLALSEVFRRVYEKDKHELPKTIFIATGRGYWGVSEEELKNKVLKHLKNLIKSKQINAPDDESKVLLVTEYIYSGGTISRLIEMFHEAGFLNVDVAAVSSIEKESVLKERFQKSKIYVGRDKIDDISMNFLHHKPSLSGIIKTEDDIISKKYKNQSHIISARRDIKKIVDFLMPINF